MLFNHFTYKKGIRYGIVLFLVGVLLILVGCNSEVEKPSNTSSLLSDSSSMQSNTSSTTSDNLTESLGNDTESSTHSKIDTTTNSNISTVDKSADNIDLNGEFVINDSVVAQRDDAKEVIYSGNCAALYNPAKGCDDVAAEKLRQEILNTENTEKYYKITGKTYYFSPGGSDDNDGTSQERPLRTISALNGLNLKEGDAVLFERGSVYRISSAMNAKSGVTYGSYGKGAKPKIYASPISLADSTIWTPTKTKNVWKTSYPYKEVGGIFFEHGEKVGYKKNKLKELDKNYDFYHDMDDGILYLRLSGGNPGKKFKSIEASTGIFIIAIANSAKNINIDNLCLKYSSYMGIHMTNANNVHITNCEIGYIGGKQYDAKIRFGNAIEAWAGAKDFYVSNNWIYQTFDSAITWQGNEGGKYENITVTNNLLEYNNADIEYWDSLEHTLKNVKIDGNMMRFTSMGWGTRIGDGDIRGIEGPIVGTSTIVIAENVYFTNNTIDCPAREIIKWDFNPEFKNVLVVDGNKVYVKKSYRTTDVVLKNLQIKNYSASNLAELKEAFKAFDSSAGLYWYE